MIISFKIYLLSYFFNVLNLFVIKERDGVSCQEVFYWGNERLCSGMAKTLTPTRLDDLHLTIKTVVFYEAYLLILAKDGRIYRQDYDALFLVS